MKRRVFLQGVARGPLFNRFARSAGVLGLLEMSTQTAPAQTVPPNSLASTTTRTQTSRNSWHCRCGQCARCTQGESPAVAFYYGANIPVDDLRAFDWVVLDPDPALKQDPNIVATLAPQTLALAYLSLGEVNPSRSYARDIPPAWIRTQNKTWGSDVIDQTAVGWPDFVQRRLVQPLWDAGFRAFFLDTLDSSQLGLTSTDQRQQQAKALQDTLHRLIVTFPGIRFIPNRGFDLIDDPIARVCLAVAAESLYSGWDPALQTPTPISASDRAWLLGQFTGLQSRYGLRGVALDYVEPAQRDLARSIAEKIQTQGLIPWVANSTLNSLGVGAVELIPRRVLLLHSFAAGNAPRLLNQSAHLYGAMPLEYHGLIPEYRYMGEPGPLDPLRGRYAGVVLWSDDSNIPAAAHALLRRARSEGVPVLIMGQAGPETLQLMDLSCGSSPLVQPVKVTRPADSPAAEMRPWISVDGGFPLQAGAASQVWLRATGADGVGMDGAAITPWGGYALDPFDVFNLPGGAGARWSIDPLKFMAAALRLSDAPMPDITTRTGRRAFFVHFDADGFVNACDEPGSPLSCEVLVREFLETYRTPTLATIVVAEVGDQGIYPHTAREAQKWARRMFALDHVEIGSHTWAHPFDWVAAEQTRSRGTPSANLPYGNYLPMPDYTFSTRTEIIGSRDYINSNLSTPDKPCTMMLWPGDCDPPVEAVALAYQSGLHNMNGGGATITLSQPTLTAVWPMGIPKGDYFQVYTAMSNEETYTHNWTGPFWGFERAIETYEMTDSPRRLKALNVYFHPYMLTNHAGAESLHKAFKWSMTQPTHPIFGTQYVKSVLAWRSATVARRPEGGWRLRSTADLHQWRQPERAVPPDLMKSAGLAGFTVHAGLRYWHTVGEEAQGMPMVATGAPVPYLVDANADIQSFVRDIQGEWAMTLEGHVPVRATIRIPAGWRVALDGMAQQDPPGRNDEAGTLRLSSTKKRMTLKVVQAKV